MELVKIKDYLYLFLIDLLFLSFIFSMAFFQFPIIHILLLNVFVFIYLILRLKFQEKELIFYRRILLFLLILSFFRFYDSSGEIYFHLGPFYFTREELKSTSEFFLKYILIFQILFYSIRPIFQFHLHILKNISEKKVLHTLLPFLEDILFGITLLPEVFTLTLKHRSRLDKEKPTNWKQYKHFFKNFTDIFLELYVELYELISLEMKEQRESKTNVNISTFLLELIFLCTGVFLGR